MSHRETFAGVVAGLNRDDRALTFLGDRSNTTLSFADLADISGEIAARWAGLDIHHGDRVMLVMSDPLEFVLSLVSAMRAGVVPVPVFPPLPIGKRDSYRDGLLMTCRTAGANLCLVSTSFADYLGASGLPCRVATFEELAAAASGGVVTPEPSDPALIQFTSGSTGSPKGVVVRHRALVAHARVLADVLAIDNQVDRGVSWLPLYHDMGLVGKVLVALLSQTSTWYQSPLQFVRDPVGFLRTMSDVRGTISFAPNFAYGLLATRATVRILDSLDLSAWRIAGCGAEPVWADTLRRFASTYAPAGFRAEALRPCYGLAEATLAVSIAPSGGFTSALVQADRLTSDHVAVPAEGDMGRVVELVSAGVALPGTRIRIVDTDGRPLNDGCEGEITVNSDHLAAEYVGRPELTARTWRAGWLHTADTGFLSNGELYVTGRIKDLIIVNGKNYQPHDIERVAEQVTGVRPRSAVAIATRRGDSEAVHVIVESISYPPDPDLGIRVAQAVRAQFVVPVHEVTIVGKGVVPMTTSGKPRRRETAARLKNGQLTAVSEDPAAADRSDPKPAIGTRYTIKPGDTITEIAFVAYGDARRHLELAVHNKGVAGFKPTRLQPGIVIDIPEPDYLPMPRGVGGLRGGVGKSFSVRPVPHGSGLRHVTDAASTEGQQQ